MKLFVALIALFFYLIVLLIINQEFGKVKILMQKDKNVFSEFKPLALQLKNLKKLFI